MYRKLVTTELTGHQSNFIDHLENFIFIIFKATDVVSIYFDIRIHKSHVQADSSTKVFLLYIIE